MTDNDIEDIQTIDVKVTAESIDAHVMCLKRTDTRLRNLGHLGRNTSWHLC
jgi:hypothetical protein